MEEALNNLAEAMKEFAYKFMEKIKGIFEKQSNDSYFLSSHTKDYFQNQFITYKKSSFDIIIKL